MHTVRVALHCTSVVLAAPVLHSASVAFAIMTSNSNPLQLLVIIRGVTVALDHVDVVHHLVVKLMPLTVTSHL